MPPLLTLIRPPLFLAVSGIALTTYISDKIDQYHPRHLYTKLTDFANNLHFTSPSSNPSLLPPSTKTIPTANTKQQLAQTLTQNANANTGFKSITAKMIELKAILDKMDAQYITLPNIVVIGAQSAGKSSVLESIVGQKFLPKGDNMVTRRPLELRLMSDANIDKDYAVFSGSTDKISDFSIVQSKLAELNSQVNEEQCIDPNPICLTIHSPSLPDLMLVDLPGYIALEAAHQPPKLRNKIQNICSKYIAAPNIILAVSAADVDLANSQALKASKTVDPLGVRTIGVITKMDLITPAHGAQILQNKAYPLELGYVGVICNDKEQTFFEAYADTFRKHSVGISSLRSTLTNTLQTQLHGSLSGLRKKVGGDLAEATYQFKVEYNDRVVTPDSYVAELLNTVRARFKELNTTYAKPQVRSEIREMLEGEVLRICEDLYWKDPRIMELATSSKWSEDDWIYWKNKLETSRQLLTKSGLGRSSTQLVHDSLMTRVEKMVTQEPFTHHASTRRQILQFCSDLLRNKLNVTIDQVENTIKPFKFEVECSESEWSDATIRSVDLLETQMGKLQKQIDELRGSISKKQLRSAMQWLQEEEKKQSVLQVQPTADKSVSYFDDLSDDPAAISPGILKIAKDARKLQERSETLQARLNLLRPSRRSPCKTQMLPTCEPVCPEPFLLVVTQKLVTTATLFIWIELLSEIYFAFPRELDSKLVLKKDEVAMENPEMSKLLTITKRKEDLELIHAKLKSFSD